MTSERATNGATMYRRGKGAEYRVRDHLAANGYWVMLSPGSKSPIDVVAIKPGQVLFIQVKRDGTLGPAGWNALIDAALPAGATPVLAERPSPRVLAFWELTGRKDGTRRPQPMRPFVIDTADL